MVVVQPWYNAKITYKWEYRNAQGQWIKLNGWSRPFTMSQVLDETLDTGLITINADLLQKLPPFTLLRLTITMVEPQSPDPNFETVIFRYFVSQANPVEMVRFA